MSIDNIAFALSGAFIAGLFIGIIYYRSLTKTKQENARLKGKATSLSDELQTARIESASMRGEMQAKNLEINNLRNTIDTLEKRLSDLNKNSLHNTEKESKIDKSLAENKTLLESLASAIKLFENKYNNSEIISAKNNANLLNKIDSFNNTFEKHAEKLGEETALFKQALVSTQQKGIWGEIQLKNLLLSAGLKEGRDFEMQYKMHFDEQNYKPDCILYYPENKCVIIDSKASVAFGEEKDITAKIGDGIKRHIDELSKKDYSHAINSLNNGPQSLEFVIMFIPSEGILSNALEKNSSLLAYGMEKKVVLATPSSLWVILNAIKVSWQQKNLSDNAMQIISLASELYKRFSTLTGHAIKLGANIEKSVKSYNQFISSYQSQFYVQIQKMQNFSFENGANRLEAPLEIDMQIKEISKGEMLNNI